jgi:8-oxo-dGTP pyrophosphatase MutT (NUDIX family)
MNKNSINVYVGDFKAVFVESPGLQKKTDITQLALDMKGNFTNQKQELVVECTNIADDFIKFCSEFIIIEAAGGLIKNKAGQYMFIYRHDKWDLPKGKIDKGEKVEDAALRECREECGIQQVELKEFLTHSYHIYLYKGNWAIKKTHWYLMESEEKNLIPQLEESITEVTWKNTAEIPAMLRNTYHNIMDVLEKAGLLNQ